jgi:hypothetical protein
MIMFTKFSTAHVFSPAVKNENITIYNIPILLMILYGCEILSLTLREEQSSRVFEKRVLRRIIWTGER